MSMSGASEKCDNIFNSEAKEKMKGKMSEQILEQLLNSTNKEIDD